MTDHEIAPLVCTPKELDTWNLATRGLSTRAISLALGVSRSTVRSRLENTTRKISAHRRSHTA